METIMMSAMGSACEIFPHQMVPHLLSIRSRRACSGSGAVVGAEAAFRPRRDPDSRLLCEPRGALRQDRGLNSYRPDSSRESAEALSCRHGALDLLGHSLIRRGLLSSRRNLGPSFLGRRRGLFRESVEKKCRDGSGYDAPCGKPGRLRPAVSPKAVYMSAPVPIGADRADGEDEAKRSAEESSQVRVLASPVVTWPFIWSLMMKEKLRLFLAGMAVLGGTSAVLMMPRFSGRFFEAISGLGSGSLNFKELLIGLGILYSLEPIFTVIFVSNICTIWENVVSEVRTAVFERILLQKIEFFDRYKVGELTGLISVELGTLRDFVNDNVQRDRGLRSIAEVGGTLIMLWFLSAQLAPILGFLVISIAVGVSLYRRTTAPFFLQHGHAQSIIGAIANETFGAIRTVRSFGGERRQMGIFNEQVHASQTSGIKLAWLKSVNESYTRLGVYLSLLATYALGGSQVKQGALPVRTMVAFIGYTFTLTFAVQGLVNTLADLRNVLGAVERINTIAGTDPDSSLVAGLKREKSGGIVDCMDSILEQEDDDDDDSEVTSSLLDGTATSVTGASVKTPKSVNGVTYPDSSLTSANICRLAWSGDVAFSNVSFAYPARNDVIVLNGVSFTLPRGKMTALVGPSGSGKSTVVQLISRFYEPVEGKITLGGVDVRSFDKSEWARTVALVNQDPVLFATTVRENIAYGLPSGTRVDQEAVIAAAKAANAHDFIQALPQGYDTLVGERGGLLSGGQRQRVAIARALLKNSPILILDEATSALDSVSEKLVQEALNRLMLGRTSLVIAHRLSTTQSADQIAVIDNGRVIELGTHPELIAQAGAYANLVNSQRLLFE